MRKIFRREVLPERSRYNYKIHRFPGVNAQKGPYIGVAEHSKLLLQYNH